MSNGMRVQAKAKDGVTEVKVLMNHPMESGLRKDPKSGELAPAHFIEEVLCEYNGKVVMEGTWSGGISKNPYLAFKFKAGQPGEKVKISWKDNKGETESQEVDIK